MPRPKEYSRRIPFTSSMEGEKLERVREICRINRFEMNSVWDDAANDLIERHSQGLPVRPAAKQAEQIPTIKGTMDEMKRYIMTQATPDEAAIIESQLRNMANWIRDSKNSISLNYKNRIEGKIKVPTV